MNRRELLEWLLATGGLAAVGRLPASSAASIESLGRAVHRERETAVSASGMQPGLRSLDDATAAIVTAAAECIIPRTDTPGATDAGVTAFVDVLLTDWYDATERVRFLDGMHTLDTDARSRHGRGFAQCAAAQQVALLDVAESRVMSLRRTDPAAANASWFAMLKYLTVFGYCTSEPGMREHLRTWPPPMTYDPAAPVRAR